MRSGWRCCSQTICQCLQSMSQWTRAHERSRLTAVKMSSPLENMQLFRVLCLRIDIDCQMSRREDIVLRDSHQEWDW